MGKNGIDTLGEKGRDIVKMMTGLNGNALRVYQFCHAEPQCARDISKRIGVHESDARKHLRTVVDAKMGVDIVPRPEGGHPKSNYYMFTIDHFNKHMIEKGARPMTPDDLKMGNELKETLTIQTGRK